MRLRGNLELDMEWFDGRLEKASFKAFSPGSMTVYYHEQSLKISYKADDAIELGPGLQVRK
jgi:alpha-L-fucosidase 2